MAELEPNDPQSHNVRVVRFINGDDIVCNFTQVTEGDDKKFVAYQCLYPLHLSLSSSEPLEGQDEVTYRVTYRRWNPYTPYEDHRVNPSSVVTAMPPAQDILRNYCLKLEEAGVDMSFLPNNGNDILGRTDGEPTQEPTSATTEGPVATSEGGGD